MKIAVCDDNSKELSAISKIVDEYITNNTLKQTITYTTFQNGTDLLAYIGKGKPFDILILDVVMPLINGIELATEIRVTNSAVKIIFLTSTPEYAVDSYSVNAFNYLLKPIKKEVLLSILEKASVDILEEDKKFILVKFGACLTKIPYRKIQYIEVVGRSIFFHLKSGEVMESLGTMAQLEIELLCHKRFIKPYRSFIVNMDYIKNLSPKGIITITGAGIPISRTSYKELKQAYISYSFERGD